MIQPNEILTSALRIYSWARYTLIFDEFDAMLSTVNSSRNGLAIRNANSELILNCYEFNINILFEDLYNNRNVFTCLIKRYVYTYTLHTIQYNTLIYAGFFFIKTERNRATIFVPYKWCVIDGIKVNLICTQTEMWIVWKWVRANKKISNDNCALCICAANIYMTSTRFFIYRLNFDGYIGFVLKGKKLSIHVIEWFNGERNRNDNAKTESSQYFMWNGSCHKCNFS